uniref:Clp R domain-containing protein n=1 Tax=Cucumis sativus TaxID=3659 RepID=A0A0A0K9E3_CUCSA
MRAGICTIQLQALSIEAEATVKQAIGLARRRGHAHVTPLHVASAMLASSSGLLRRACLHCHSHPLQCKALELCFNVALNRLPTSTPSPLFGPQYPNPCLSNALVAAFKRAQAHQRRGSIENQQQQQHQQQQPILALKIELEQLIISILDDPSVSRVMREAGFSSTQVKNRVEKAVSLEDYTNERHYFCEKKWNVLPTNTPIHKFHFQEPNLEITHKTHPNLSINPSQSIPFTQITKIPSTKQQFENNNEEEVTHVLEELSNRMNNKMRRVSNTIIVGESLGTVETIVRGVMERFEKGEVPKELKHVEFLSLNPLFSLRNVVSKEEIEQKILELRCIVKSCMGKRVIFYLGDLKWVSEFWSNYCYGEEERRFYSYVEELIMEIKRLVNNNNSENYGKFWVLGIATFQMYMKCKVGHPSLDSLWSLHPLTVPVGSLSLSLNFESKEGNFPTTSAMAFPLCLEQYKEDARKSGAITNQQDGEFEAKLLNSSVKQGVMFTEKSPSHYNFLGLKPSPKEYQFWGSSSSSDEHPERRENIVVSKPDLLSNPNSSPNSASSTKEKAAREIAKIIFGSQSKMICMGLSNFKEGTDGEKSMKKRGRNEMGWNYLERFAEAVNENPHRVFFIEDIEQIDYCSLKGLKEAIEKGRVKLSDGEFCSLKDAIIIINSQKQIAVKQEQPEEDQDQKATFVSLDLNIAIQDTNGDQKILRSIMEECVHGKILFS